MQTMRRIGRPADGRQPARLQALEHRQRQDDAGGAEKVAAGECACSGLITSGGTARSGRSRGPATEAVFFSRLLATIDAMRPASMRVGAPPVA